MLKYTLLNIFGLISINLFSQPAINWQKNIGGSNVDAESSIIHYDNSIFCGFSSLSSDGDLTQNSGAYDISFMKMDNSGNIIWKKTLGGNQNEKVRSIAILDNYLYITGYTESGSNDFQNPKGGKDLFIIKSDLDGNVKWNKRYGGSLDEDISEIRANEYHQLNCFAHSKSSNGNLESNQGGYDYWYFQMDTSGNILNDTTFGGSADDISTSGLSLAGNEKLICGISYSTDGDRTSHYGTSTNSDIWVVKLDSLNHIIWQKTLGGNKDEKCGKVSLTASNDFILCGSSESNNGELITNNGLYDGLIIKILNSGNIGWVKRIGGTASDYLVSGKEAPNGNIIACGSSYSNDIDIPATSFSGKNFWIVRLHSHGDLINQSLFGGNASDDISDFSIISDNNILISGNTDSQEGNITLPKGSFDVWLANLEIPLSIESNNPEKQNTIAYYNPVNQTIDLLFNDSETHMVQLFSLEGKLLDEKLMTASENALNVECLPKGMYILSVTGKQKMENIKILKY